MELTHTLATASTTRGTAPSGGSPGSVGDLGSQDFLKLLIAQLQHQDPLEPLDNNQLLEQIASVREIELSAALSDSLRSLVGQERFLSASTLIGQYVTAVSPNDGTVSRGIVVGVRFAEGGRPILQLADGSEVPVDQVSTVEPPLRAAEALIGQAVVGLDRRDPKDPEFVEGVVAAARLDNSGEVWLELDTGQDLRFRDLISVIGVDRV